MARRDDHSEFLASLAAAAPPAGIGAELEALWWCRKGDWDRAHRIVQDSDSRAAAHVHAHLHRVEGDLDNAAYWYRRAAQPICRDSLDAEWEALVAQCAAH
jgi:hypothetical protein